MENDETKKEIKGLFNKLGEAWKEAEENLTRLLSK